MRKEKNAEFRPCYGEGLGEGRGFQQTRGRRPSEILFPSGRGLGQGDWRNTNPYELGTLVDLGFAFSLLMHCFMLSFFRGCSDGNAARKEHGADIISSNFSPRGISVTSLPHKILSCEFPTWQPCFVSSRLDQNPSTAERMPSIQAAAWRHGLKWTISGMYLLRHVSMPPPFPHQSCARCRLSPFSCGAKKKFVSY